ncbi:MAG: dihydropteroate synthase [Synergistota bacterium]|nr:dihydropteroate synthase [Synergistota bacterium]
MPLFLYEIRSDSDLEAVLEKIGADRRSFPYFKNKTETFSVMIPGVDFRAANVLKQEILSRGGDAVVHRNAIAGQTDKSDVMLLGTRLRLQSLASKLEAMPYWGLSAIQGELAALLRSTRRLEWKLSLKDGGTLDLGGRTKVMGIVNITPDSFHAASRRPDTRSAMAEAAAMVGEGADMIDIGAESSRPGAKPLEADEEIERLVPFLVDFRKEHPDTPVSVDTYKARVAEAALGAGADIINDISSGGMDADMFSVLANSGAPVVLMHMKGTPATMQQNPQYGDIIAELVEYFTCRIEEAVGLGVDPGQIIIDPGIGFGKKTRHNLEILRHLESLTVLGRPVLIGHSRKSLIGKVLDLPDTHDRLEGTVALSAFCAWRNTAIVRAHDVTANLHAIRMIDAIKETPKEEPR